MILHVTGQTGGLLRVAASSNLVANAVKFTASGEVHLRAAVAAGSPAWLRIAISDTGIGMTAAQRSRLFEAFE